MPLVHRPIYLSGVIINVKNRFCLAAVFCVFSALSTTTFAAPVNLQPHSCHLPGYDQPLRCQTVPVPLDYQHPSGEKIMLHVAVAPSFRESAKPDPLFILTGGPGQAASDAISLLDSTFLKARATRDIVFIDQRGTGLSGKLDCDIMESVAELPLAEQETTIGACLRSLHTPFAFYTTDHSARDIDQVRNVLGYASINVWGISYGTRLGQAYARQFPDHLRALILDGVAAPDQIIFAWGRDAQASLDANFKRCADDVDCKASFPMLRQQFNTLLQQVNAGAITLDFSHPRTARKIKMQLVPSTFLQAIRTALYASQTSSRLPFIIDSAEKGNWGPFLAQAYTISDFSSAGPAIGLMLAVTCAEDVPRLTPAIIAEEEGNSFLAGAEVKLLPSWCRFVNVPAAKYAEATMINTPVLLLSGALDPVTPPRRAEAAIRHMSHAQHFVVANAGHGVSTLGCTPKLLREFLDHPEQTLDAACLKKIPPTPFQLGAAGPRP